MEQDIPNINSAISKQHFSINEKRILPSDNYYNTLKERYN